MPPWTPWRKETNKQLQNRSINKEARQEAQRVDRQKRPQVTKHFANAGSAAAATPRTHKTEFSQARNSDINCLVYYSSTRNTKEIRFLGPRLAYMFFPSPFPIIISVPSTWRKMSRSCLLRKDNVRFSSCSEKCLLWASKSFSRIAEQSKSSAGLSSSMPVKNIYGAQKDEKMDLYVEHDSPL